MLVVVCGGIGVGKSVVNEELKNLGAYVLSADEINKEMLTNAAYLSKLAEIFPEAFESGKFDKRIVRTAILGDEKKRKALNALSHGAIISEILKRSEGRKLTFVEVPLLSETTAPEFYDKICIVRARDDIRVKRITARDKISESEALAMIELQRAEEALLTKADFIIDNNGDLSAIRAAVKAMYSQCSIG